MIYNKKTKQAFVLPPKTGTRSIRLFCKLLGWKEVNTGHAFPNQLIEKYPNLNNYEMYGFLRDPLKRFESAILYSKNRLNMHLPEQLTKHGFNTDAKNISYETVVDLLLIDPLLEGQDVLKTIFSPQVHWLDHSKVTVLDFENFESELRRIVNNYDAVMPRLNQSLYNERSEITQKVRDFVRETYAADYKLAKDVLGKEYPL